MGRGRSDLGVKTNAAARDALVKRAKVMQIQDLGRRLNLGLLRHVSVQIGAGLQEIVSRFPTEPTPGRLPSLSQKER